MEKPKAFMVACCGCGRAMNNLGEAGEVVMVDGLLHFFAFAAGGADLADKFASFDTQAEADQAAADAGWSIRDDDGPNHRCQNCKDKPPRPVERRGAYIRTSEFLDRLEKYKLARNISPGQR